MQFYFISIMHEVYKTFGSERILWYTTELIYKPKNQKHTFARHLFKLWKAMNVLCKYLMMIMLVCCQVRMFLMCRFTAPMTDRVSIQPTSSLYRVCLSLDETACSLCTAMYGLPRDHRASRSNYSEETSLRVDHAWAKMVDFRVVMFQLSKWHWD